ncbi:hypothetical protein AB1L88_23215 [Tautonia sp. JC769]|uniref:hypothetical protein n=1 Tax=Tautonia sp. JC769 TaxID=3232135 RepID=UPI0034581866
MAYIEEICTPLLSVLRHTAGLPVHQLAGHVANIDFWVGEVKHRLDVINGYQGRFEALRSAQEAYQAAHGIASASMPLMRSTHDSLRKQLRRELVEEMTRVLRRCAEVGLLEESRAEELRDRLAGSSARMVP